MSIRKKDLQRVGYFNPLLESGGDVKICHKLIKDKNDIYYESKSIVKHLYPNSLLRFIDKYYYYGKWNKFNKKNFGFRYSVQMPTYIEILNKYGIFFLFFRILEDVSYKFGLYFEQD